MNCKLVAKLHEVRTICHEFRKPYDEIHVPCYCKLLAMNDESCMHLCYEKCTGYSLDISGACIARQLTAYPKRNISDRAIIHHKDPTISLIHISSNLETHSSVSE